MPDLANFKLLTNRATVADRSARFVLPEDGFIQLVPRGAAPNERDDGERIIQLVDDIALESMLQYLLNRGGEMLVDYDHFSHELDKSTESAAWIPCDAEHLQNRADGLYGKPRWSTDGEAAVTGGRFRYISPEFPDRPETLVNVEGKTWRPLAVTGFGLTNRPGFRRDAKPLTNSGRRTAPADNPNTHTMHKTLLALALGLPETELDKLTEEQLRTKVEEQKKLLLDAQAAAQKAKQDEEAAADAFMLKNRELPALKNKDVADVLRTTFLNNRAAAEEMVKGWTQDSGLTEEQRQRAERKPLHNREGNGAKPTAAEEQAAERRARKINARANALLTNREESTWASAFRRATEEIEAE